MNYVDSLDTERRAIIQKQLRVCDERGKNPNLVEDTPYTTLVHGDLWTNNVMIKRGKCFLFEKKNVKI